MQLGPHEGPPAAKDEDAPARPVAANTESRRTALS
jgi:hypothetical protein